MNFFIYFVTKSLDNMLTTRIVAILTYKITKKGLESKN